MRYKLSESDIERFWDKVAAESADGCWSWHGSYVRSGRPVFWLAPARNNVLAYRVAYSLVRGEIPDDKNLDHQCNNLACVNPFHLEPLIQRDNVLRSDIAVCSLNARKMQCKRGHPLVPYVKSGKYAGKPWRKCHICAMEAQTRRRKRQKRRSQLNLK